ncbi:MAG TPA: hypothetical protein DDX39_09695 [Bacteroidales bacterium]|nr:MAG: hypothetical protein A2W98_01680 [Bacteroidetes bacterium GWF2_33_38]OFY74353.1 MAG: hypothetical protein A2265_06260 [Bacteroidetes bacterium RIFOXYA12_FULL_33_9]OFY84736.1 MAG: hypothetical protein A2236_04990 [Bacteroidetes bacterium RIFOXYA2_FULL_33_7]HBF88901.1 hypothetical protein [Bacteroidales bacterium]
MQDNILIVEDDKSLNALLSLKLSNEGYDCTSAFDGKSAIELIKANDYTLVLLDYKLPDYNAHELISYFLTSDKKINFVVITGNGDERIAVELMKLGAIDYIVKDEYFNDVLPTIVEKIINSIRLRIELEKANNKIIESEKLYKSLVKQLPDIIIIHHNGKILFVNEVIFNYLPSKNYIGTSLISLFSNTLGVKTLHNLQKIKKDNAEINEINLINNQGLKTYFNIKSDNIFYKGMSAFLTILTDITKIKLSEEIILKATIETQEQERARIAEDLHDDLGPILSSIKIYSNLLLSNTKTEKEKNDFAIQIQELVDLAIKNIRTLANNLMPNVLKDFGLIDSVDIFCETINKTGLIKIEFESNLEIELDNTIKIVLYRVITELINNSIKHAKCNKITLSISQNQKHELEILYKDDGRGIDSSANNNGMGLKNICNRLKSINAKFLIHSNGGFRIDIVKEL